MTFAVNDITLLRALVSFGALIGVFQIKYLRTQNYTYSYLSLSGLWSITLMLFLFITTPIALPAAIHAIQTKIKSESELDHHVAQTFFFCGVVASLTNFIAFKILVARYINLINKLIDYTHDHGLTSTYSLRKFLINLVFCVMVFIPGILSVSFLTARLDLSVDGSRSENSGLSGSNIKPFEFSWVYLKWIYGVNVAIVKLSVVYSMALLFIFTNMIQQRLEMIQVALSTDSMCVNRGMKRKPSGNGSFLNTADIKIAVTQIIQMKEIFSLFQNSISFIVFIFISLTTVLTIVRVYHACHAFLSPNEFYVPFFQLVSIAGICSLSYILFSLTNCGEHLLNQVNIYSAFCF